MKNDVVWVDEQDNDLEIKNDPDDKKFCGGFKASLKVYLKNIHDAFLDTV